MADPVIIVEATESITAVASTHDVVVIAGTVGGGDIGPAIAGHVAAADPHPGYLMPAEVVAGAGITVDTATTPGSVIITGQAGVTDHGALTGLADADHPISAVIGLQAALDSRATDAELAAVASSVPAAITAHEAAADPHPQYTPAVPSDANPVVVNLSGTQSPGTSENFARADHRHVAYTGTPVALGSAAAMGTSTNMSRADHVHPYPSAADVGADPAGTASNAVAAHAAAVNPHPGYLTPTEVVAGANITVDTATTPGSVIITGGSGLPDATAAAAKDILALDAGKVPVWSPELTNLETALGEVRLAIGDPSPLNINNTLSEWLGDLSDEVHRLSARPAFSLDGILHVDNASGFARVFSNTPVLEDGTEKWVEFELAVVPTTGGSVFTDVAQVASAGGPLVRAGGVQGPVVGANDGAISTKALAGYIGENRICRVVFDTTNPVRPVLKILETLDAIPTGASGLRLGALYDVTAPADTPAGKVLGTTGVGQWGPVDPPAGGGGGVTDHGALTGLGDDDHPQYLNNARGDARYATPASVTSAISAHEAAADPHPTYLTVSEADARYVNELPISGVLLWQDTFDRANCVGLANVGNGWTAPSSNDSADIVSNQLVRRQQSTTYGLMTTLAGGVLPANYYVEMVAPRESFGPYWGLVGRWGSGIGLRLMSHATDTFVLGRAQGFGNDVALTVVNPHPATWTDPGLHRLGMDIIGSRTDIYLDRVLCYTTSSLGINIGVAGTGIGFAGEAGNRAIDSVAVYETFPSEQDEYLTRSDADARYTTEAYVGSQITGHVAAADPHPGYLMPAEVVAGAGITVDTATTPGSVIITGQAGVTDHGALTGLSDDDHPQYLTQARGDTRYPVNVSGAASLWIGTQAAYDAITTKDSSTVYFITT